MPLLSETDPRRRRRLPVWAVILAVGVLPLVGLFAWGWYWPMEVRVAERKGVAFGRFNPDFKTMPWVMKPNFVRVSCKLPGGRKTGWYLAAWRWE